MKTTKISQVNEKKSVVMEKKSLVMRKLSLACLGTALCAVAALAQVSTKQAGPTGDNIDEPNTSPVAYVYVANGDITAYSAASNGKLTPIPGSPFSGSVGYLAGNGKYLFVSTLSTTDIETYAIESNGALHYVASENAASADGGCGNATTIFTDHTGETLYDLAYGGFHCSKNTFEEFSINQSTGKLTYLGLGGDNNQINGSLSFTGNDLFAYSAYCYRNETSIFGFKRSSDGKLTKLNINPAFPDAPENDQYCPLVAESDPSGHLAVSMQAFNPESEVDFGPILLATYTVSSSGNLTTSSTTKNMPAVNVGENINAMTSSPSGKLLAVAGTVGLQVFHFNGDNPITHYTELLNSADVYQIFWDNSNHLYAISATANKLWVFTVTPTGYSQAPGSPYSIDSPQSLRVMPLAQ